MLLVRSLIRICGITSSQATGQRNRTWSPPPREANLGIGFKTSVMVTNVTIHNMLSRIYKKKNCPIQSRQNKNISSFLSFFPTRHFFQRINPTYIQEGRGYCSALTNPTTTHKSVYSKCGSLHVCTTHIGLVDTDKLLIIQAKSNKEIFTK